ncbi:AAA family ATPase [Nocardioides sp. LHG3406-4]|uniref:AAA family ATPase n=1 Tax=Nocardioides sp. LHG3406-4 TaxID=2804575 RepID=UPI003CFA6ED7
MICVLLLASGATWESTALESLSGAAGVVVLKRCVDVDDLLASAGTGQAHVVVLSLDAPGLDAAAIAHLRRHAVRPVAVVADPGHEETGARAASLGISTVVAVSDLGELGGSVTSVEDLADTRIRDEADAGPVVPVTAMEPGSHRVVVVWGPAGAPGRTTVATALATQLASRRATTLLVDADPWAGAVAQHLGILDEVSGVLSAARLASSGQLRERFPSVRRAVGDHLGVLTGLPRADRWVEVRAGAITDVLELAREQSHVVVDTGFSVEQDRGSDFGAAPARNTMTLEALEVADDILVVGSADPVGLSRLARALVDLRELTGGRPVRVAVNRMRPSLGWAEKDIAGMVEGFARISGLHFLPDDRAAVDRALVAGRSLSEGGETPLSGAIGGLVDAMFPATMAAAADRRTGFRRRTAGRARRR